MASRELRLALTETFAFYFQAHTFHWNVTGPQFVSLHNLFGDIYADAWAAVDGLAERIRTLDEFAPTSPREMFAGSKIEYLESKTSEAMLTALSNSNEVVISALRSAFLEADRSNPGLSDFIQSRLDTHAKWHWMLKAQRGSA